MLGLVLGGGLLLLLCAGGVFVLGFFYFRSAHEVRPAVGFAKDGVVMADVAVERAPDLPAENLVAAVPRHVKAGPVVDNTLGMKLALIPAGEFVMGSPPGEQGRKPDEGPQHRVRITKPFWMGAHEITYGNFRAFVKATAYNTPGAGRPWENPGRWVPQDDDPVVNVSWDDADAFCKWLSRKEDRTYRLPTEAEWEYACRAGTVTAFHYGNSLSAQQANFNGQAPYKAPPGPFRNRGVKVGSFAPNAFGLYDMHGNVWEWCLDRYDPAYYRNSPVDDPLGPPVGTTHPLRSGGYWRTASDCRAANREAYAASARFDNTGFRIVREHGADDPAPADVAEKEEPAQGQLIDILKLVDPKADAIRGNWHFDGPTLVVTGLEPFARLALPVQPTGDYHLLVKFKRIGGQNGPIINLPVGSKNVQFAIDSGNTQSTALEFVDGHSVDDPKNPTSLKGIRIVDNKTYTLEAQVLTKDDTATLRIDLDGKRILDWTGQSDRLSISKDWSLGDDTRPGLHPWGLDMRFEAVQLRMLSGDAKLLRAQK
jgi:formylglycine-generating enzyme required for sulfatase activity